jgi:hypothetical protein
MLVVLQLYNFVPFAKYESDQAREDAMGSTCSIHERDQKPIKILNWKSERNRLFGIQGLKVKIILKWMLKKLGLIIWT